MAGGAVNSVGEATVVVEPRVVVVASVVDEAAVVVEARVVVVGLAQTTLVDTTWLRPAESTYEASTVSVPGALEL